MKRRSLQWLAIAAVSIAGAAPGAAAQPAGTTVYRCGPDGREYSATPCTTGKAIDVADPRSADQQRQAAQAAQREAALADQLAHERRAREKAALRAKAVRIGAAASAPSHAASAPKKARSKKKRSQPEDPNLSPPMRAAPTTKPGSARG